MSALFLLAGVEVLLLVLIKVHIWQNERLIREIRRCNDDLAAALWFFASQERFREAHGAARRWHEPPAGAHGGPSCARICTRPNSSQRVVSVGCEDGNSHPLLLGRAQFVQGVGHLCPYFVALAVSAPGLTAQGPEGSFGNPGSRCDRRSAPIPSLALASASHRRRNLSRPRARHLRKRQPYHLGSLLRLLTRA